VRAIGESITSVAVNGIAAVRLAHGESSEAPWRSAIANTTPPGFEGSDLIVTFALPRKPAPLSDREVLR
jgi:hypothetical protein